jgi:hypothetical protein
MHYAKLCEVEPIDISKDVLRKIKLDFKKDNKDYYFCKDGRFVFGCYFCNEYDYYLVSFYQFLAIKRIQLHELQNMYYILINEELEIEL